MSVNWGKMKNRSDSQITFKMQLLMQSHCNKLPKRAASWSIIAYKCNWYIWNMSCKTSRPFSHWASTISNRRVPKIVLELVTSIKLGMKYKRYLDIQHGDSRSARLNKLEQPSTHWQTRNEENSSEFYWN